ncbi:MAG: hypothetical protein GY938_13050 [Ketobacter sp.]|nr:hypothetical protein [Ketobacter sp.]
MIKDSSRNETDALEDQAQDTDKSILNAIDEMGTLGGILQHEIEVEASKLLVEDQNKDARFFKEVGERIIEYSEALTKIQDLYSKLITVGEQFDKMFPNPE